MDTDCKIIHCTNGHNKAVFMIKEKEHSGSWGFLHGTHGFYSPLEFDSREGALRHIQHERNRRKNSMCVFISEEFV